MCTCTHGHSPFNYFQDPGEGALPLPSLQILNARHLSLLSSCYSAETLNVFKTLWLTLHMLCALHSGDWVAQRCDGSSSSDLPGPHWASPHRMHEFPRQLLHLPRHVRQKAQAYHQAEGGSIHCALRPRPFCCLYCFFQGLVAAFAGWLLMFSLWEVNISYLRWWIFFFFCIHP